MTKTLGPTWVLGLLVGCLFWFGACSSDDDANTASSSDCAITSVVMGALYRDFNITTVAGNDSSYVVTLYGNYYPLSIDQLTRQIYNVDSLPYGTRVNKVRFTTFTADGTVGYRLASGRDTLYTTSDSIDFTEPRVFTCYAGDGNGRRSYTVRINVASLDPTAYTWRQEATAEAVAAWSSVRLFTLGDTLYAFGLNEGQLSLATRHTAEESEGNWTEHSLSGAEGIDTENMALFGSRFYALSGETLMVSADGATWNEAGANIAGTRLMGAGTDELYMEHDGQLYRSSDGCNFTAEELDDTPSLLPATTPRVASMPSAVNDNVANVLMVGFDNNEQRVWKKELHLDGAEQNPWSYYPITTENGRTLPAMADLSLFVYASNFYAVGLQADTVAFWISRDGGRTWMKRTDKHIVPAEMAAQSHVAAVADEQNYIWIVCAGNGQVWRGRLNSLAGGIITQ